MQDRPSAGAWRHGDVRTAALTTAALVAALAVFSGCSSDSGTNPVAARLEPSDAASLAAAGNPSAAPTPSGSAGSAATPTKRTGYVDEVASDRCRPDIFRAHAALARGAFDAYVRTPAAKGTLRPAVAAQASSFAADQLTLAAKAVTACPAAKNLRSVSLQTAGVLDSTATAVRSGTAHRRVAAADAMLANVVTQARRLKLDIAPKTPTVAQLGR